MVESGANALVYLEKIASVVFVYRMNNKPRRPGYSIDGFVSNSHGRHVGTSTSRPQPKLQGVRQRRPGFYIQPSVATQPTARRSAASLTNTQATNRGFGAQPTAGSPMTGRRRRSHAAAAPHAEKQVKKGHPRFRKFVKRTSIVLVILALTMSGWLGLKVFHATNKVFGSGSNLLGFLSSAPLNCENTGRCTILLAGNSADDPGHDGANLTDSIMLVSINMQTHTAFMLSVPRDLYVQIPGGGSGKINEVYPDGQAQHFSEPGYAYGGMGLLEKTVSQDFGIPVNYYALIDYSAIKDSVDAVGGINVDIQSQDPRGLYDPSIDYATHGPLVKLANGWHNISGEQALDLARARGDAYGAYGFAGSDFERTQNQRMMMVALKDKVTSSTVLANPIKLGELFDAIGNNLHTDLTTSNIRRMYDLSKQISSANIKSYGLNSATVSGKQNVDLLKNYLTSNGEDALIPAAGTNDYSQIQLYVKQLTSNNAVVNEAANVVILNGGNITGLAAAESQILTNKGIQVSATGDAPASVANQTANVIIDNSQGKDPATLSALKSTYSATTTTNATLASSYPNAAFIIVLGSNQQMPPSSQSSSNSSYTTSQ
jgi:LCP family protein required for cell wall assembly